MNIYAGIGSRKTPGYILSIMMTIGEYFAEKGWALSTGACVGADQAFAKGALKHGGTVNLFLPWHSYEKKWINGLRGNVNITVFDPTKHEAAVESVYKFHPAAQNLKRSVLALHARNYLILDDIKFAVCYTPGGKVVGGTGQAIRIINDRKRNLFNLGNGKDLQEILDKL
jgi:predicted Rossmann-fold nucleotide-binding protein